MTNRIGRCREAYHVPQGMGFDAPCHLSFIGFLTHNEAYVSSEWNVPYDTGEAWRRTVRHEQISTVNTSKNRRLNPHEAHHVPHE